MVLELNDAFLFRALYGLDLSENPPKPSITIPSYYSQATNSSDSPPTYRIAQTPDMGLGVFATRRILTGEVIISEAPLFQPARTPADIEAGVAALNAVDKELFFSFFDAHRPHDPQPLTIMRTNGISLGDMGPDVDGGLFPYISRINHSCQPNVAWRPSEPAGETVIVAIGDIAEGEELLVSYINLSQDKVMRGAMLAAGFKIGCQCSCCGRPHDKASNARRERMAAVPALVEAAEKKGDAVAVLRLSKEQVRVRDEEDLNDLWGRASAYHGAFKSAVACSDPDTARRIIRLAYAHSSLFFGLDHFVSKAWLAWSTDPEELSLGGKVIPLPVICDRCGKEEPRGTKAKGGECGECHTAMYCSKKCKVAHAARHKAVCAMLSKSR